MIINDYLADYAGAIVIGALFVMLVTLSWDICYKCFSPSKGNPNQNARHIACHMWRNSLRQNFPAVSEELARVQQLYINMPPNKKRLRERLADVSLFLPFAPMLAYIYGAVLIDYVRWHVRESRESNTK